MADLQKKTDGKGISYPGTPNTGDAVADSQNPGSKLYIFLNGGTVGGKTYPKVDMSLWDQATMCGTCHVGGKTYETDREGNRLPMKTLMDMGSGEVNPFTTTVWESFTPEGLQNSFATIAPWIYPQYKGNNPANGPVMANPANAWVTMNQSGPVATGELVMNMKNPNTGTDMPVVSGQLMMPNVKEMDCLFCHLSGYDNVMSSVMTQAGSLNAAPGAGAGMFDISPMSPTYMGYTEQLGAVTFTPYSSLETGRVQTVSMSASAISRIKPQPEANNCMQCHATKTLKNLPEMFGVTGGSSGFLSSAPMVYDPVNGVGPLGKRMVSYDLNAMWLFSGSSPAINGNNYQNYMMAPGMAYLQAMDTFKSATLGFMGGNKPAGSGPLYYDTPDGSMPDQNVLKRSTMPFPRAEWFKRGDAWQPGQDVHGSFGCGGCHYTGDKTHKNQCDPGRGHDMSSTTQDGVPPISQKQIVTGYDVDGKPITTTDPTEMAAAIKAHDTRNTVKRCEFCHVTGKDYYGQTIDTYGAPNPNAAHERFGLTANTVQIVDKMDVHGGYGGQGVSEHTNFTTPNTMLGKGNHLDVMDCTVCHVQKVSMAVRALDATSGMRFPAIVGTDPAKGMVGLFEDPAPSSFNEGVIYQYNQMYAGLNAYFGLTAGMDGYMPPIPSGTHVMGGALQAWKPLHMWQKQGNMEGPLSTDMVLPGAGNGGNSQLQFRRKLYLSNAISAIIWNNTDPNVDANGDSVKGGLLVGDDDELDRPAKASLVGYTDIFDGTAPNKNNTQGYGEPIYDPWIMRDLKEGMNFAPSALSVISVGFDNMMTTPSGSAYDQTGLFAPAMHTRAGSPDNYWKYASVWSGAVVFTEPDQIADYKAYRNTLEDAKPADERKDWTKTELAYVGAPFMVTHGVKPTATYVKGTSCADCHAPGKGFFTGGYTMTGTAIPADRTFNPTSTLSIDDATGVVTRTPGVPGFGTASNLMQRPLEPIRVKALKGELRTVFEGFNKLGQPRSSKFEATDGTYVWTKDLERSEVLYPEEDGAIYYKISQTNADGSIKPNEVPMNGAQYAAYMETIAANTAAFGIGVAPVAAFTVNGGATSDYTTVGLVKGAQVDLVVPDAKVYTTYSWDTNAGTGATLTATTGSSSKVTFTKAGTWRITLTATNPADGKTVTKLQRVNVTEPQYVNLGTINTAPSTTTITPTVGAPYQITKIMTTVPVTIDTLIAGTDYDSAKFNWGDGSKATTMAVAVGATQPLSQAHQYARYAKYLNDNGTPADLTDDVYKYKTTIQLFKGTTLVSSKAVIVTIPK
ncbi:MAG TPA: hypothetical protein DCZ75_15565 [Geobacter sp.]|nr:hypothetical protein [Geobacter sp.]